MYDSIDTSVTSDNSGEVWVCQEHRESVIKEPNGYDQRALPCENE